MKKNRNLRNKICSGFLALTLAGTPLTLVKAEEQIIKSEQEVSIMNKAEALEDIIRHPHLHKYVSEDGSKFKWICSEEPVIDGLNWTEETMEFDFSFEKSDYAEHLDNYDCPVEGYHQHLYGFMPYGMGTVSKDQEDYLILTLLEDKDIEWAQSNIDYFPYLIKSPIVVMYSEEDYQMMKDLQIMPAIFNCMELDLYEKKISSGSLGDFKLLVLSIKNEGDYYLVSEKLISRDELLNNAIEYPYAPYILEFSDTYQPKTDYKVYKKTK